MATPRYFQGTTVTGPVHASTATCFADVVEVLNVCPTLPITRKAFLAMNEKERNTAKQVPFFVPACFQHSPSPRNYENATHCNLVFLDIDGEKVHKDGKWVETGRHPAAPFVNDPELLHQALAGLNFVAHTTASSTSEKPRMRVIVDSEAIPLELYPKAVEYVAGLLGLPSITKESKVPVQPMFSACMFRDDTEDDHPIIARETDASKLLVKLFQDVPEAPKSNGTNGHSPYPVSLDGLEFLRAPVDEITLDIAREALSHISPDCSYHEWMDVAFSLRHQFCPLEEDEAYQLFDEWSSGGNKYASADETRAKWNSARPTPIGREPKTIRSLLKKAAEAGWDDERLKDQGYKSIMDWMEKAPSPTALLEQGVRKILAAVQLSATQEGMLMNALRSAAKDRFGHRVSVTDIRKDLERLRLQAKPKVAEEKKKVPAWANGLCFVHTPKEFYRPSNGEKYKPDSFNLRYGRYMLPTPQQLIAAGIPVTEANLAHPVVSPTEYVLNILQCPCYTDYAYSPAQPNEMLFVHEKKKYVNTYAPTYPETDPSLSKQAGKLFMEHMCNLVAEQEYLRVIIDFMAYQAQFPGQKVRWAVLIQGVEGAGKTYLAEVMKAVLGRRHVKTVDGTTITSGWNEWTFGYQMVVIEEVRVAGTNRFDIMNRLKPWITNEDIPINEKFRSSRDAQNITNYMLFSNHHDALTLTPGDRRYFVVKSALQRKEQVLALGKDYFKKLFNFLTEHPGAMRAWLLDWKISEDFAPHSQAPRTKYAEDLINDSASDVVAAVRKLMLEGDDPLLQYDIVSASVLMDLLLMEHGIKNLSAQHLAHVLREEGFQQLGRHLIGNTRHYLWVRSGVTGDVVATATERVKRNSKRLEMEIIYG